MKCIFGSENIHALIGDGAAVNGNACNALIPFLPMCGFPICLFHSMNVAGCGLRRSCTQAKYFIQMWAIFVSHGGTYYKIEM